MRSEQILTIISLVLSAGGIFATVYIFYSTIDKKLRALLEKQKGVLTYRQAIDLSEIYVGLIQAKLKYEVDKFIDENLSNGIDEEHLNKIILFVNQTTDKIVDEVRQRFTNFEIISGESFKDFVGELLAKDVSPTALAKRKAIQEFEVYSEKQIYGEQLKDRFFLIIMNSGKESIDQIRGELKKRYIG